MSKSIKLEYNKETKQTTLDLAKMLEGTNVDIKDVAHYSLTEAGGSLTLLLFDKDKKQLMVKNEEK